MPAATREPKPRPAELITAAPERRISFVRAPLKSARRTPYCGPSAAQSRPISPRHRACAPKQRAPCTHGPAESRPTPTSPRTARAPQAAGCRALTGLPSLASFPLETTAPNTSAVRDRSGRSAMFGRIIHLSQRSARQGAGSGEASPEPAWVTQLREHRTEAKATLRRGSADVLDS
jgi:hypothetical protein